jgi:hypothetical protein
MPKILKEFTSKHSDSLTTKEIEYISNFAPRTSRFYVMPKVHKSGTIKIYCQNAKQEYIHIGFCPSDLTIRPIISNIDSPTSHLSHFLDVALQPFIAQVPGYVRDTFDFIEKLPRFFEQEITFICLDVKSLYTNIPFDFGLEGIKYWLQKYPSLLDERFSISFILDALYIILSNNTFVYNKKNFRQIKGTAMGTKVAPKFAHLVMGYLEMLVAEKWKSCSENKTKQNYFQHYWRFLDDIFIISTTKKEDTMCFINFLCSFHPSFQFTTDASNSSAIFLDVFIYRQGQWLETDIHHKSTDAFKYLHFQSKHPRHIKRNIPYCLAHRVHKIVSDPDRKNFRFNELKLRLVKLKYPVALIDDAIRRVQQSRSTNKQVEQHSDSIYFKFTYNKENTSYFSDNIQPRLAAICSPGVMPKVTKVRKCLRQPPNLLRYLNMPKEHSVKKCHRPRCKTCQHIIERKGDIHVNNKKVVFNQTMDCTTKNVIYILFCKSCGEYYVGETELKLSESVTLHRQQINREQYSILRVSCHVRNCGSYFNVIPIFCLQNSCRYMRKKMEFYFIRYLKPTLNSSDT